MQKNPYKNVIAVTNRSLCQRPFAEQIELVNAAIENLDFTDEFTNAVEAKQVAEQNKIKAKTEAEQRVIEANAAAEVKKSTTLISTPM